MNNTINAIAKLSAVPFFTPEDIYDLMDRLGVCEKAFAILMNVTPITVRLWCSGVVYPGTAANRLMQIYDIYPDVIGRIATDAADHDARFFI